MLGECWSVAMAEHADFRLLAIQPGLRFRRHLPSFIQHMTERNSQSAPSQEASSGKPARFVVIHIAGDRRDRRNRLELIQEFEAEHRVAVSHVPLLDVRAGLKLID